MFENEFVNIPQYAIKGFKNFYFDTNGNLINTKTKNVIKERVKCCSKGYELSGKFITTKKIKYLKIDIQKTSKNYF